MTFIDQIYHDNKKDNYPKPGPGKYNIRQTEESYKEELKKYKERKMFICWNDHRVGIDLSGPYSIGAMD